MNRPLLSFNNEWDVAQMVAQTHDEHGAWYTKIPAPSRTV